MGKDRQNLISQWMIWTVRLSLDLVAWMARVAVILWTFKLMGVKCIF